MSDRERDLSSSSDSESLLRRLHDLISAARALPLSSSVKLDSKDEVLELLEEAIRRFPEEVRQARWLLHDRAEYLAKVQREGDEILEAARQRAQRMVQRTEVVRNAQAAARNTVEDAREEARRLRHEAEDYCDEKLAAFEIVLERTLKTVSAGREKLGLTPPTPIGLAVVAGEEVEAGSVDRSEAFFDQDRA